MEKTKDYVIVVVIFLLGIVSGIVTADIIGL
jgi:hypothetical protein